LFHVGLQERLNTCIFLIPGKWAYKEKVWLSYRSRWRIVAFIQTTPLTRRLCVIPSPQHRQLSACVC
jgi:hypothetical protein